MLVAAVVALTACSNGSDDAASSIVRTTTNIAGADVVGVERDTTRACPLPSDPDQAAGTRAVTSPAGVTQISADPKRIVVLDTAALDAACGLGLWQRVVGATTLAGPSPQPSYLGYGLQIVPSVGVSGTPDVAKIAAMHPDLVLGTVGDGDLNALRAAAPTVLIGKDPSWQSSFSAFADALGRPSAGAKALADYHAYAHDTGVAIAASLSQASVLRFGASDAQVQGADSFAGRVLADAGVQRPQAQRGASYQVSTLSSERDRARVEGDIIYVMFDGEDGKSYGQKVMHGDDWKNLGAVSDKRDFVVDDTIWHGTGITAARALIDDLRSSLNGYVND
ncbi:ABC transporter substrate-binding protein [Nocardia macrotermitis]|uniref:Putative siderophore-binding lipoprotein YfiY n=1 Tax=Nocardia macrotermitis TaxID=2585198 RepID=A0A7K0DD37_9NOCA|nr:ABC transporter substrate-binding protein [Nocardia macrotermitis]MQY23232.1 putative siderophore-binding lipoprotein YfiY [Nocardia macrotermitis]